MLKCITVDVGGSNISIFLIVDKKLSNAKSALEAQICHQFLLRLRSFRIHQDYIMNSGKEYNYWLNGDGVCLSSEMKGSTYFYFSDFECICCFAVFAGSI